MCCLADLNSDRCVLTFFAIQEPGISRYCGSCSREYLHEDYALNENPHSMNMRTLSTDDMEIPDTTMEIPETTNVAENHSSDNDDNDESTLQTVFRNHDVCIFCGGKFVG